MGTEELEEVYEDGAAFPLSDKQVVSIARADGRVNIYDGAVRAGKTFASILAWVAFVAEATTAGQLAMVGKNKDSLYRNVFEPIETQPALEWLKPHAHYRQGSNVAYIFGRKVHVIGANDDRAENRIRGMTLVGAYVDEVTVIPEGFFKQLLARMSVRGARLFGTTNPDSPAHWLKVNYLDKIGVLNEDGELVLPGWKQFHFLMTDNPSLDDEYIRSIKAEYSGLWYRRFVLGMWVSADGAIYDMWDAELFNRSSPADGGHVVKWEELPRMVALLGVGIDYGTTNPTSAIMLGLGEDGRLYAVDEYRHDIKEGQLKLSDAMLSAELKIWMAAEHLPYNHSLEPQFIFLDPSAASLHTQMTVTDKFMGVTGAENDVLYGLRTVSGLLSQKLLLVADRCTGLIKELPGYSWDDKKQLQGIDAPVKANDHSCDGLRYVVATSERMWRPRLNFHLAVMAA